MRSFQILKIYSFSQGDFESKDFYSTMVKAFCKYFAGIYLFKYQQTATIQSLFQNLENCQLRLITDETVNKGVSLKFVQNQNSVGSEPSVREGEGGTKLFDKVSTLIQVYHKRYLAKKYVFLVKSAPNMKSSRVLKGRNFSKITEIGRMGSVLIHKVGC